MRMLFIALILTGCAPTPSTYYVEKYPIEWDDTIIYKADHWHFQHPLGEWICVELDADTVVLNIRDTIYVKYKK